jgi:hypothetical protein
MADGQFSEKPTPRRPALTETAITAKVAFGPVPGRQTEPEAIDLIKELLRSPVVQREVNALMDLPVALPEQLTCELLPSATPTEARRLGSPLAHACREGTTRPWIQIIARIFSWFAMIGGCLGTSCLCFSIITDLAGVSSSPVVWGFLCVHFVGTCAYVYIAIFHRFKSPQSCWFCPRGIIWQTHNDIDWRSWDQVDEFYVRPYARRPAFGLRLDGELAWFVLSNRETARQRTNAVEALASQAKVPTTLQYVAEGQIIQFGVWQLNRFVIRSQRSELPWKQVAEVIVSEAEFIIRDRSGAELAIAIEQVPFPGLFLALARAMHAYWSDVRQSREG